MRLAILILLAIGTRVFAAEPAVYGPPVTLPSTRPAWKSIGPGEFQKLAKEPNAILLDVRTAKEFKIGYIRGAVNIDATAKDFPDQLARLDKSKTYLVYCRTGQRSTTSLARMHEAGFRQLYHLEGGIVAWRNARRPLDE